MKEIVYKRVLATLEATLNEHKPELNGMKIIYELTVDENGYPRNGGRLLIGIPAGKTVARPNFRDPLQKKALVDFKSKMKH